ncbi:MAG: phosphate/phosphite/phosphonate ABC transporter substrate-binding protein [Thiobacillus sp.]
MTVYLPLAKSMEKQLGRPVAIYSARDFGTFVERTRRGEFDIVLTAPHLAWLAHQDAGYAPLMKYAEPTRGLLVVARASAYRRPEEMRGRTIATADASALTVLATEAELAARGIERRIDYRTRDAGTHLNAVMQVLNGRADAVMLGLHPYLLLPPEVRARLRILAETGPLSSLMYLTHPRLRARDTEAIRRGILAFAATAEGARFLRRGGYGSFVPADDGELPALQAYALQVREMLRAPR